MEATEEVDKDHSRGSGGKRMQRVIKRQKSERTGPGGKYSSSRIVGPLRERRTGVQNKEV